MSTASCPHCGHRQPPARVCEKCEAALVVAVLEGLSGALLGRSFDVGTVPFRIGRAPENELCLADPSVSRNHATIHWAEGAFAIEDEGSRFGVYVDGARVKRAALAAGTRIQVGDALLQFSVREVQGEGPDLTYSVKKTDRQDLLLAVIEAISSTLVLRDVLASIVDAVVRITRAERGFLLLTPEDDGTSGALVCGLALKVARQARGGTPGVDAILTEVVEQSKASRAPVVTRVDQQSTTGGSTSPGRPAITTVVCLPVREPGPEGEDDLLGVIYADNPSVWTTLDTDSLRAAEALARHAALAIHNARLFEREQRANRELRRARDEAVAASKAKSTFLAIMSHELHTPLNAIMGYGEMIQERAQDRADDEELADVDKLLGAGRHLLKMVDAVLDASELESGGVRIVPETFDTQAVLADVVAEMKALAQENGNEVTLAVDDGARRVHTDRKRLRQVAANLLSNAVRFTQGGRVHVGAAAHGGGRLILRVTDTGPGMTEEQLARAWQPFTQVDSSTTRRHDGLGLGLAVSRKVCEALGGTLDLTATPGAGCVATVSLPGALV